MIVRSELETNRGIKMFDATFDYSGKTAVITGAGSGLGRAMALALADCGADIVGAARRQEPLEESKSMVEEKAADLRFSPVM